MTVPPGFPPGGVRRRSDGITHEEDHMLDMDPQVREAWVKGLRSGEYPQGKHYLHVAADDVDGEGLCCLGVLCEVAVKAGVIPPPRPFDTAEGRRVWVYGDHTDGDAVSYTSLPFPVAEWAGLAGDTDPMIAFRADGRDGDEAPGEVLHRCASDLNDNLEFTFAQIADAIEEADLP